MKKIKNIITVASIIFLSAFILIGCGKKEVVNDKTLADIDILYSKGEYKDNTYINTFFNIKYETPTDWQMLSIEQLESLSEKVGDNANSVMAFYSQTQNKNSNINMRINNMGVDTRKFTDDEMVESFYDKVEKVYKNIGYTNLFAKKDTVDFLGEKVPAIYVSGKLLEKEVYQVQIILKRGSYYALITSSSTSFEEAGNNLKAFSKFKN